MAPGPDKTATVTESFDSRVVKPPALRFLQACQRQVPFHLGGGAALAGVHLHHRLSADLDLFFHDKMAHREAVKLLPSIADEASTRVSLLRDAGTFVRGRLQFDEDSLELDLVFDPVPDVQPPPGEIEGVLVESLADLRANKLTCILSRSEPRDLVDLLFLDRAGFPPERDMELGLQKDGGLDPGILAWLLTQFPVQPLPRMLVPLTTEELREFRDELAKRFRHLAVP